MKQVSLAKQFILFVVVISLITLLNAYNVLAVNKEVLIKTVILINNKNKDILNALENGDKIQKHQLLKAQKVNVGNYFINAINAEYKGKVISPEIISEIIRKITNEYVSRGFITTRIIVPKQNIMSGNLFIAAIEGEIGEIELITNGSSRNLRKTTEFILPMQKGRALNIFDLEQSVDQYKGLKSKEANFKIEPGARHGDSKIVINETQAKPWSVVVGVDNNGSKVRGAQQYFNKISIEDALGLKENINLNYRNSVGDLSKRYSKSSGALISFPYNYSDISLTYNNSSSKYFTEVSKEPLEIRGGNKSGGITLSHLLYRNGQGKTTGSVSLVTDNQKNFINEQRLVVSSYIVRKKEFGINHQGVWGANIINIGANITQGKVHDFILNLGPSTLYKKDYAKLNYNFSLLRRLPYPLIGTNISYSFAMNGQYAKGPLVGSEKIGIGGLSSVRGFKEYSENSDNGKVFRNEIIFALPKFPSNVFNRVIGGIETFYGIDYGAFKNRENKGYYKDALAGWSLGLRNRKGVVNFDLTYGKPMGSPNFKYVSKGVLYLSLSAEI